MGPGICMEILLPSSTDINDIVGSIKPLALITTINSYILMVSEKFLPETLWFLTNALAATKCDGIINHTPNHNRKLGTSFLLQNSSDGINFSLISATPSEIQNPRSRKFPSH